MNKQEIIDMAREAGYYREDCGFSECDFDALMRLFALATVKEREARKVAQLETIVLREELTKRAMLAEKEAYQRGVSKEREACAKVCEDADVECHESFGAHCASAIRARNNMENTQ